MNAKELMIGDLVISTMNKAVYQIDPILAYGIIDAMLKNDPDIDNHFEPIPLTPEILEKNGFKYFSKSLDYVLRSRTDIDNVWSITAFETIEKEKWCVDVSFSHLNYSESVYKIIKYVHQLQHALRLCGLNELADNFKV